MQHLVPDLSGEGAGEDEVVHGLRSLVTYGASRGVLQAAAFEAVCSPTSVEVCEPVKEPDARRSPVLPCNLRVGCVGMLLSLLQDFRLEDQPDSRFLNHGFNFSTKDAYSQLMVEDKVDHNATPYGLQKLRLQ